MDITADHVRWNLRNDRAMGEAVRHARIPLCISDPNAADNPIVFVNDAFLDLTGYEEAEVIGRNCRFLQGPETTSQSVDAVRRAIEERRVDTVEINNYRKDGSSFVNALQIGPILDDDGTLVYFFGSQLDVTERREEQRRVRRLAEQELVHRLRNIVNVMSVVIRMTAREEEDTGAYATLISERLKALSEAHFQTINLPEDGNLTLEELSDSILRAYAPRGERQFGLDGFHLVLPTQLLSCMALTLHELATNSVKYGALGAETGRVAVDWVAVPGEGDGRFRVRWTESGGPPVKAPERHGGSRLISDLIMATGGSMELHWEPSGLIAEMEFPL
ncbi:PAS domain-containing protein [Amaricoccus tamworthensis]|uniref:PAS domain-containing protein n=1 Tax=Amaricoccus tamworthensis TaxID=57002 RepID=UPI003C7EA9C7